jgi:hypothetical protein
VLLLFLIVLIGVQAENLPRTYHVDCATGDDSASGLAPDAAWRTIVKVNNHYFQPGDSIRFRRGTSCTGKLAPQGSGRRGSPITLSAYGAGPLPVIHAGTNDEAAFRLFNQEYWRVENLELIGGNPHGVFVSGDKGVLRSIHLTNLVARDVTGRPTSKEDGIVVIAPGSKDQRFDDIIIDGVTAYRTSQWAGILVGGVRFGVLPEAARSSNVVVRNSIVYDVQGDGIILFQVNNGRIENSVAWHTGMQEAEHMGTPNAIWTWMCRGCAVQRNEAFLSDSPGVDGGAFDIDYGSDDTLVAENYGHDTQGYCVAVFAAGRATTNSVVRDNVCANNGLSPRLARRQGAIFVYTWDKGTLEGLRIERNRIYWTPPIDTPALVNRAGFTGKGSFSDNTIVSSASAMADSNASLAIDRNIFEHAGSAKPAPVEGPAAPAALERFKGNWTLAGFGESRSLAVLLQSAAHQFRASRLQTVLVMAAVSENLKYNWNLDGIQLISDAAGTEMVSAMLISPDGNKVWQYDGLPAPGDLGLALRYFLGEPVYGRMVR